MSNPVNSFICKINEHPDYDLTFITSCIDDLNSKLDCLLADIDVQVTKSLMEAIGYEILDVASQHIIVRKNSKRVAFLFCNDLDSSIDATIVIKVNRENIRTLISDYLLDYLCSKYETLTYNVTAFQYIKGVFYHNK